jgi:tRNA (cmo5U34)-methyltransferase
LRAVKACREILSPGGVLVVFENVAPETQEGIRLGLTRWATFQVSNGKTKSEAEKHVGRYGKGFFPITPRAHLALFKRAGFRTAELFWLSHLQAGFYAIR